MPSKYVRYRMEDKYMSQPLRYMPKRIILVDQHNWANVGSKLEESLSLNFDVRYIIPKTTPKKYIIESFNNPKESLIIFIEPNDLFYKPKIPFYKFLFPTIGGISRPISIPYGFYWCGSIYRITNFTTLKKIPPKQTRYFTNRRAYFNSRTALRMVATECLTSIDIGATFVGQPYSFPDKLPSKPDEHFIIHIPTKNFKTNIYKGTGNIINSFKQMKIRNEIITYGTPNPMVIAKLNEATMYVMTMTDWDSGTGYGGIEALSNGCLVFSKKPKNTDIKSPIIHVENGVELVQKVNYYDTHRDEYEIKRKEQYEWAKSTYDLPNVSIAVKNEIKRVIDTGWKIFKVKP